MYLTSQFWVACQPTNTFVCPSIFLQNLCMNYTAWQPSLSHIDFLYHILHTGCTDLLRLNLHNNDISVIADNAFSHLPNLTRLTMSNNALTQLYDNTLSGLFSLTELDLKFNIGLQISHNAFDDLGNLQKLILERASISQVSAQGHLSILLFKDVLYIKARKIDYFTSSALPLQP